MNEYSEEQQINLKIPTPGRKKEINRSEKNEFLHKIVNKLSFLCVTNIWNQGYIIYENTVHIQGYMVLEQNSIRFSMKCLMAITL